MVLGIEPVISPSETSSPPPVVLLKNSLGQKAGFFIFGRRDSPKRCSEEAPKGSGINMWPGQVAARAWG